MQQSWIHGTGRGLIGVVMGLVVSQMADAEVPVGAESHPFAASAPQRAIRPALSPISTGAPSSCMEARFAFKFGGATDPGRIGLPGIIGLGTDGRILVWDRVTDVFDVFDVSGRFNGSLQIVDASGAIVIPTSVAIGRDGQIVMTQSYRVLVADANGLLLFEFGEFGTRPGQFRSADGVAVADDGRIFVADDFNHRVQVFSASGEFLMMFGEEGEGPGQFNRARDVAVGADGQVVAVDGDNLRVHAFDATGAFSFTLDFKDAGKFWEPVSVGIDATGRVFVADEYLSLIYVFSPTGEPLSVFGGFSDEPGAIDYLVDMAVVADRVVVSDDQFEHVAVFDGDGMFLTAMGDPPGELRSPGDVLVRTNDEVVVLNRAQDRLDVFDAAGTFQNTIGSAGSEPGQFDAPQGIAEHADGRLFVADGLNDRV